MALTNEQIDSLILPCLDSTPITGVTLFPEHFTRPFCSVHSEIFNVLDDDSIKLAAIAAPRGFGKTTTIGLGFVGRKALFRQAHYIVYISSTATEAAAKVKTLAKELQENEIIKSLFGDLKGVKWAEEKGEIELSDSNGPFCFIQAKGAGSQIRGLKWGKYRPELFVIDDLEDSEAVCNEVLRKKLKEWFFADVLGARDQAEGGTTRLIVIGTILHEDALLANLIDETPLEDAELTEEVDLREQFVTLRLEACDDNFNSVWPEYLSSAALKRKCDAYEKRGLIDVFYREWRNIVIAKGSATFQKSFFQYYRESELRNQLQTDAETVILVDPAKTANTTSAFTAILAVAIDQRRNRIYLRDGVNLRLSPEDIFKTAFDMADLYNTHVIGIEETGLNNFLRYPMETFAAQRNRFYDIQYIKAIKEKELRIGALAPFYRISSIFHNSENDITKILETQLMSFPRSKYWDVMDCLANLIAIFNIGERFFTRSMGEVLSIETGKPMNEYEIFEMEDKLEGPLLWRNA